MDKLLVGYEEAAEILSLESSNQLRENIREYPHRRIGRNVLFSADDLREIVAMSAVRPALSTAEKVPAALLNLTPGRTASRTPRRRPA